MKNIILLGATGSIGTQVLDEIKNNQDKYNLIAFSFNKNVEKANKIIDEFQPLMVATANKDAVKFIKSRIELSVFTDIKNIIIKQENTILVNAISGYEGIVYSYDALNKGIDLYLANKESLVAAGDILIELAKKRNAKIVPIDSEHTALMDLKIINKEEKIVKYYITASGGSFRDLSLDELKYVKKEDALKHPTWKMGPKITIDSATMMNKVFEIVEAAKLYSLSLDDIDVLIDRKSNVHACLEFANGKIMAHVSNNDMHLPIKFAISDFEKSYNLDLNKYSKEELFSKYHLDYISKERYPALKFAEYILTNKSFSGIIITTINDLLVNKFLNDEISFCDITDKLFYYYDLWKDEFNNLPYNIENILFVKDIIERRFD